jgi:hypothetical protein
MSLTIVIVTALTIGCWIWARSDSRINGNNFRQVWIGMTKADVEAILGPPTRRYEKSYKAEATVGGAYQPLTIGNIGVWAGPEYLAVVHFDADDVVIYRDGAAWYAPEPEPVWPRMRRWLHL